jgi:hypothetical protein
LRSSSGDEIWSAAIHRRFSFGLAKKLARRNLECGDSSPLSFGPAKKSGDESPHSKMPLASR